MLWTFTWATNINYYVFSIFSIVNFDEIHHSITLKLFLCPRCQVWFGPSEFREVGRNMSSGINWKTKVAIWIKISLSGRSKISKVGAFLQSLTPGHGNKEVYTWRPPCVNLEQYVMIWIVITNCYWNTSY